MPEKSAAEKTEKPTSKKREEARKKGDVAKSRELPAVAVFLSGLIGLSIFGSYMYAYIEIIMKEAFSLPLMGGQDIAAVLIFFERMLNLFFLVVCPLMAVVFITALLSNIAQVGFMFSGESIKPKFSKINPFKGIERLFSKQAFVEFCKSLMKLATVGVIAYFSLKGEMKNLPFLGDMEPFAIVTYILLTALKILLRCIIAMVFLVVIDYAFQKWEFENKLKMTKQEVKEEYKKSDGDPLVKSRIRSIQIQMSKKRMMQSVPEADVVVTNPTRLAVAIKYNSSMSAPKLLAKGAGKIAGRIKKIAGEHNIPIVENKELAQGLYSSVELEEEIPSAFYQAVAEVLAYVYRLKEGAAHAA